jgi:hypothetical protein
MAVSFCHSRARASRCASCRNIALSLSGVRSTGAAAGTGGGLALRRSGGTGASLARRGCAFDHARVSSSSTTSGSAASGSSSADGCAALAADGCAALSPERCAALSPERCAALSPDACAVSIDASASTGISLACPCASAGLSCATSAAASIAPPAGSSDASSRPSSVTRPGSSGGGSAACAGSTGTSGANQFASSTGTSPVEVSPFCPCPAASPPSPVTAAMSLDQFHAVACGSPDVHRSPVSLSSGGNDSGSSPCLRS